MSCSNAYSVEHEFSMCHYSLPASHLDCHYSSLPLSKLLVPLAATFTYVWMPAKATSTFRRPCLITTPISKQASKQANKHQFRCSYSRMQETAKRTRTSSATAACMGRLFQEQGRMRLGRRTGQEEMETFVRIACCRCQLRNRPGFCFASSKVFAE